VYAHGHPTVVERRQSAVDGKHRRASTSAKMELTSASYKKRSGLLPAVTPLQETVLGGLIARYLPQHVAVGRVSCVSYLAMLVSVRLLI
jgi:hypothetical protein